MIKLIKRKDFYSEREYLIALLSEYMLIEYHEMFHPDNYDPEYFIKGQKELIEQIKQLPPDRFSTTTVESLELEMEKHRKYINDYIAENPWVLKKNLRNDFTLAKNNLFRKSVDTLNKLNL